MNFRTIAFTILLVSVAPVTTFAATIAAPPAQARTAVHTATAIVSLSPAGGVLNFPAMDGSFAAVEYGTNDAFGSSVTLANLGQHPLGPFPMPPVGRPVLYMSANLNALRPLTFAGDEQRMLVKLPFLQANVQYGVLVYSGRELAGASYGPISENHGVLIFESPVSALTLQPGKPLVIEVVAAPALPPAVSKQFAGMQPLRQYPSKTVTLSGSPGTFPLPAYGGFSGTVSYTGNNSRGATLFTVTNSGTHNVLNAPAPPSGIVALYLQAQIAGASSVTFSSRSKKMTLTAKSLVNDASYAIDEYAAGSLVASYPAGLARNKTLAFQTPFSGLTLASNTPLTIEVADVTTNPTPTPSPSPSPTPIPTPTPTPTVTPTPVPTSTPTPTPTETPTPSPTPIPTYTPLPTPTPTPAQILYVTNYNSTGGLYFFDGNTPGLPNNFLSVPDASAVAVDDSTNVYVSQDKYPNSDVEEFPALGGGIAYYNDVDHPGSVAVGAGASPLIDVANEVNLLIFPQGVNNPEIYSAPNFVDTWSVAVDAASNGYLGGCASLSFGCSFQVDYLETNVGTFNLGLQLQGNPFGLLVDTYGNLLVLEFGHGIAVFPPGQTTPSGWYDSNGRAGAMALGNGGNWLYVLDYSTSPPKTLVYLYPQADLLMTNPYMPANATQIAISPRVPLFNPNAMKRRNPHFRYWSDFLRGRRPIRPFAPSPHHVASSSMNGLNGI